MAHKIRIDDDLYERIKNVARIAGYATPEEFVIHMIEKELAALESPENDEDVAERLRGLGYLE